MNVLFLSIDLFSFGGVQRYSRYVLRAFEAAPGVSQIMRASLAQPAADGFGVYDVSLTGGAGVVRKSRFALGVLRLARARRAGVIVCDHVNVAPIALACSLLLRTPYIVNVYAIEVWGDLSLPRRRALLGAARIVSDCEFTRRRLEARFPTLRGRITVVPDCVDVARFVPGDAPSSATFSVLTLSRMARGRSKGHDTMLRAVAALRDAYPRLRYLIAGDGDDRPRLEALAHDLGVDDIVEFLGGIDEASLPAIYQSCHVFALVSAFSLMPPQGEGVPLAVLEAQACGKPVITSNADGSAESIVDGVTGYLVDPGDVSAIAARLSKLIDDRELCARMGAAARRLAETRFSFEAFATRTRAVLDALVDGRALDPATATEVAR